MKRYCFLLIGILVFQIGSLNAQIEKIQDDNFKLPANKKVKLNLKFARNIKVNTWSKKELGLKTYLKMSEAEFEKIHIKEVLEQDDRLVINTDYENMRSHGKYNCWSCDNDEYNGKECVCFETRYEILLPSDANLSLETISGNIEIKGLTGKIRAKSISGFVDVGLKPNTKSNLRFKSVTGEIYTDFNIELDKNSSSYSKKLNTRINGGGDLVSLETVSGDIFFRKEN